MKYIVFSASLMISTLFNVPTLASNDLRSIPWTWFQCSRRTEEFPAVYTEEIQECQELFPKLTTTKPPESPPHLKTPLSHYNQTLHRTEHTSAAAPSDSATQTSFFSIDFFRCASSVSAGEFPTALHTTSECNAFFASLSEVEKKTPHKE